MARPMRVGNQRMKQLNPVPVGSILHPSMRAGWFACAW